MRTTRKHLQKADCSKTCQLFSIKKRTGYVCVCVRVAVLHASYLDKSGRHYTSKHPENVINIICFNLRTCSQESIGVTQQATKSYRVLNPCQKAGDNVLAQTIYLNYYGLDNLCVHLI